MIVLGVGVLLFSLTVSDVAADDPSVENVPRSRIQGILGPGLAPTFYAKSRVLESARVRGELRLTEPQRKRLADLETKRAQASDQLSRETRVRLAATKAEPDAGARRQDVLNQANLRELALREQFEAEFLQSLDPVQNQRLDEIRLRAEGFQAFRREALLRRLDLTPEQAGRVTEAVDREREKVYRSAWASARPILPDPRPGVEPRPKPLDRKSDAYKRAVAETRRAAQESRQSAEKAILDLLTEKQRTAYQGMLGQPFDASKLGDEPAAAGAQE